MAASADVTGTTVFVVAGGGFLTEGADGVGTVIRPMSEVREVQSFAFQTGSVRVEFVPHSSGFGGDGFDEGFG
jgi:hypothetical protein